MPATSIQPAFCFPLQPIQHNPPSAWSNAPITSSIYSSPFPIASSAQLSPPFTGFAHTTPNDLVRNSGAEADAQRPSVIPQSAGPAVHSPTPPLTRQLPTAVPIHSRDCLPAVPPTQPEKMNLEPQQNPILPAVQTSRRGRPEDEGEDDALLGEGSTPVETGSNYRSTWAERNPGSIINPPRSHPISYQQRNRASRAEVSAHHAEHRRNLNRELDELRVHLKTCFNEIAGKYGESFSYIRRLFFHSNGAKTERQVSLANALIASKAEELNNGMLYSYVLTSC